MPLRKVVLLSVVLCCSFTVTAQSQSGGKKIGNSDVTGGNFAGINLVGLTTNRTMTFRVDLEPPTHCLLQSSNTADDCPCFPIYLEQDVTTVSVLPASLLLSKCVVFTYIEKVLKHSIVSFSSRYQDLICQLSVAKLNDSRRELDLNNLPYHSDCILHLLQTCEVTCNFCVICTY